MNPRKRIAALLTKQAIRMLNKSHAKVVVVCGSVGKTSTTQAIATVLSTKLHVQKTVKNYNTDIGVPCSIFNMEIPGSLKNPIAWLMLLVKNELKLLQKNTTEVFVLELGTDTPGEIASFAWLKPDIAIVTAIAAEHMECFKTLDAVAQEELSVAKYSDVIVINKRMVADTYLSIIENQELYHYDRADIEKYVAISELQIVGSHSLDALAAAANVARMLEFTVDEIAAGLQLVTPQKGRMNKLVGINGSVLIDDTYNASPEAVKAALDFMYETAAPQKIVLLGNMNELGEVSAAAHEEIGAYCKPDKLDLVIALGPEATTYLAPKAREVGCSVIEVKTPYEAADVIRQHLKPNALVLFKGSQNKVFAEEAVKMLLANPKDSSQLVRQSSFWLKKKKENFTQ